LDRESAFDDSFEFTLNKCNTIIHLNQTLAHFALIQSGKKLAFTDV